jgi:hypothetical protein
MDQNKKFKAITSTATFPTQLPQAPICPPFLESKERSFGYLIL